ncbi:MAG: hypothetical protein U1D41_01700 [Nitrosomonas sp.]|uniref:hypothetical protein n=1 Tax=Nitrosomonas sp. TaxID=42353 RepID=UPI00273426F4|nr:hypothetical protein [Nitrosomonas sp.]MDP3662392.1 hypothetical protein [Nitrosomonas sp.]MDZ4104875.1 hypothetical protein [Nitrosomonas sp.]
MPKRFLPFLPYLEFLFLVDVWLPHIMEELDIMGLLCTVTDIGLQYTPITATDINRHITVAKATLAAIFTMIVGIDMVDISTSMEGIGTMEAGTNTPVEDIGEETIEEVTIVDENDITTLG